MFSNAKVLLAICFLLFAAGSDAGARKDAAVEEASPRSGAKAAKAPDPQQRRAALRAALTAQDDSQKGGQDTSKSNRQLSQEERHALRRELQQQRLDVLAKPGVSRQP